MTLPQMIRDRRDRWQERRCMQVKRGGKYGDVSWSSFWKAAEETGLGLIAGGFQRGDKAAVLAPTCYEWAVADTAILSAGGICVPIYPSLTEEEVGNLVRRSEAKVVFAADRAQAEKCLPLLEPSNGVRLLVTFSQDAGTNENDARVVSLEALRAEGVRLPSSVLEERISAGRGEEVATIIFTSGTTGEPKGVPLTHRNILSNIEASLTEFELGPSDVAVAHLPLAHIFERMAGYYLMLWCGVTIAYAEDIQQLAANIEEIRPTIAVSVPRIFEKISAGIQAKAVESPFLIRKLTFWAVDVANRVGAASAQGRPLPVSLAVQKAVADRLVYAKIRRKLGGRIRFFISGGAPLAPELAAFFSAVGVQIYEGYGLTETSPVTNVNSPKHNRVGTVGRFIRGVSGKIAEDGEILVKGPNVFSGYFKDPDATREAFTEDGWFKTGDIGEVDSDGYLRITDRKKDLIVTAGGKNVAPQKVENLLKLDRYIAEAMLYGDKRKFISALLVPDFNWLKRYAEWKAISYESMSELVQDGRVLDFYARRLSRIQEDAHLASYETVKKFLLLDHEFSASDGEVTPTLKVRRKILTSHFRDQLDALYEEELTTPP